uniref:Uncharacterized protein K0253H11.21 n=1 Tax=Oryza sativa subsp. indica TaxID=39946 RepID=C8TFL3_ORYSI|nr:hypothetical protein [Oryza sativa Indica Group]
MGILVDGDGELRKELPSFQYLGRGSRPAAGEEDARARQERRRRRRLRRGTRRGWRAVVNGVNSAVSPPVLGGRRRRGRAPQWWPRRWRRGQAPSQMVSTERSPPASGSESRPTGGGGESPAVGDGRRGGGDDNGARAPEQEGLPPQHPHRHRSRCSSSARQPRARPTSGSPNHALVLSGALGFCTTFLKCMARLLRCRDEVLLSDGNGELAMREFASITQM